MTRAGGGARPVGAALLGGVGITLVAIAWALANPLGAAPDETSNLVRVLGMTTGDVRGLPVPRDPPNGPPHYLWITANRRSFEVPAGFDITNIRCVESTGAVQQCDRTEPSVLPRLHSYMGTYQPTAFAWMSLWARGASSAKEAGHRARVGNAVLCGALLTAAMVLAVRARTAPLGPLVGVIVGATPMVLFLAGSVSPNGLEIASGACFFAALLASRRSPERPSPWVVLAVSGAFLATTRTLGPAFLLALVALVAATTSRTGRTALRRGGRAAAAAAATLAVAIAAGVGWELAYQPRARGVPGELLALGTSYFAALPDVAIQMIGVFGTFHVGLPEAAVATGFAMMLVLVFLAAWSGTRRDRVLLVGIVAVTAAFEALIDAGQGVNGFGPQGRYLLPIAVALPIAAGEALGDQKRRSGGVVAAAGLVAWAALHLYALARNAVAYAGSRGPGGLLPGDGFLPPGGWGPAIGLAVLGTAFIASAGFVAGAFSNDEGAASEAP